MVADADQTQTSTVLVAPGHQIIVPRPLNEMVPLLDIQERRHGGR